MCILPTTVQVIIFSGIFGGVVNFARTYIPSRQRTDDSDKSRWGWHLFKCSVSGIAAALMVPLFLKMISSDVISETATLYDYLVLIGFCLVAAIFSNRFIDSLSEQIIKKVQDAEETSQQALTISKNAQQDVSAIVETSTATELAPDSANPQNSPEENQHLAPESNPQETPHGSSSNNGSYFKNLANSLGQEEKYVLTFMRSEGLLFYTPEALRSATLFRGEAHLTHTLIALQSQGLIQRKEMSDGTRFTMSALGRRVAKYTSEIV